MAISFNALPTEKTQSNAKPGTYFATIAKATMKTPKDPTKPDYLNLQLNLSTPDGKPAGVVFDIITESNSDVMRYKLARLLRATGWDLTQNVSLDLKDLTKTLPNKKVIVDVALGKANGDYAAKVEVDLFSKEVYYKADELAAFGEDAPICAPDAQDVGPSSNIDEEI